MLLVPQGGPPLQLNLPQRDVYPPRVTNATGAPKRTCGVSITLYLVYVSTFAGAKCSINQAAICILMAHTLFFP